MSTLQALQNTTYIIPEDTIPANNAAPVEDINRLRRDGLLQIVLPGRELDFKKRNTLQLLRLLKNVGRQNLSVGRIYEGHINALLLIYLFASEEKKLRWFAAAADDCLFGVWNTEATDGVQIIKKDEDIFFLTGKKTFGSGAGLVNCALVTGSMRYGDRHGWQMCMVDMDKLPGSNIDYSSWHPMGMQSSISYTVDFNGYEDSIDGLFGKLDDYYKQPFFGAGAIRFCAVQLGGAEALFNETMSYLKSLNRTEDAYQSARIADMATSLAAGNLWLEQAAINWDNWSTDETKNSQLIAFANMMRLSTEQICLRVIELSSKCVGARGLMQSLRMEGIVRDLQFYLRQPAPDAALRNVANYVIQSNRNIENIWGDDNCIHS